MGHPSSLSQISPALRLVLFVIFSPCFSCHQSYFLHLALLLGFLNTAPAADFHQAVEALANAARAFSSTVSEDLAPFRHRCCHLHLLFAPSQVHPRTCCSLSAAFSQAKGESLELSRMHTASESSLPKRPSAPSLTALLLLPLIEPFYVGVSSASSSGIKLPRSFFDRFLSSLQGPAQIWGIELEVGVQEVGCLVCASLTLSPVSVNRKGSSFDHHGGGGS
jgi:hypothetical protein